jgi:hypothetical protein
MNSVLTHFFWLLVASLSLFPPPSWYSWTHTNSYYILYTAHPPSLPPLSVSRLFVCINAINNTCILFRDIQRALFYCQSPVTYNHTHTHTPFTWRKKRMKKKKMKETLKEFTFRVYYPTSS